MDSETPISLHDANRILPELRGKVGKLVRIYKKLKKISVYQKDALDSVKTTGSAPVHPVYFRFLENLHSSLQDVTTLGCEVKDLETGLIDFPSLREGRIVYLCWRLGEDRIGHWHEVEAGFAGRKPVD
ncbi:MAG: DUF2203 domain-containing protein [Acidobacteriota bacterium]